MSEQPDEMDHANETAARMLAYLGGYLVWGAVLLVAVAAWLLY